MTTDPTNDDLARTAWANLMSAMDTLELTAANAADQLATLRNERRGLIAWLDEGERDDARWGLVHDYLNREREAAAALLDVRADIGDLVAGWARQQALAEAARGDG